MDTAWVVEHRNVKTRRTACDDPRQFAERVARLARLGERGEVLLVEAASGLVLARRPLPDTVPAAPIGTRAAERSSVP
jgi:hypothetical protein